MNNSSRAMPEADVRAYFADRWSEHELSDFPGT